MKDFLTFLTALIVLAIVQSVANAAAFVFAALLLMSVVVHPGRTLAFIAAIGGLVIASQRPGTCVAVVATIGVVFAMAIWLSERRGRCERRGGRL